MGKNREDYFTKPVKDALAKRVGYVCSCPECDKHTSGPSWSEKGSINIGVACHITAAAAGGPRYNDSLTPEQRRSEENGIWLCQDHSKIIDSDESFYTVELLNHWKNEAERLARARLQMSNTKVSSQISKHIKSYDIVLNSKEMKNNPLMDWPLIDQLRNKENSELFIDDDNSQEIEKQLIDSDIRKILISGAGGRGKTVLSRCYAYEKIQKGWLSYFIDIREIEHEEIDLVLYDIEFLINLCNCPILYVIENAHNSDEISETLIDHIDSLLKIYSKSYFIFISRDLIRDKDIDPFLDWKKKGYQLELIPDHKRILNVIGSFIKANEIEYELDENDIKWIKSKIDPQFAGKRNRNYGGDLRLLRLYLDVWKESRKKLSLLNESDIISRLKKYLLVDELSRDIVLSDLLGKVASVFQFDIPYFARRKIYVDSRAYLRDLEMLRKKGFIKFIGNDRYTLVHSLDAMYISKAMADYSGTEHDEYTSKNIVGYLKELPDTPKKHINKNISDLFQELYSDEMRNFKGRVFVKIYSESRSFLKRLFISTPHNNIVLKRVLEAIEFHMGIEEAYSFWADISSNSINDDFWRNLVVENKPFHIATLMKTVKRITPDQKLTDSVKYILSNFEFIFINSDLLRLKEFFKYLPPEIVTQLLIEIDYKTLAGKIIGSNPTNLSFFLKKLPDSYKKGLFNYIFENEFDAFLEFFQKDITKGYPKQLLDQIRKIDRIIEKEIRISLKSHFEDLRNQNRKRTDDGRLVINNKIANNYCNNKLSYEDFCKWLNRNFENGFKIMVDKFLIAKRLIFKVHVSTRGSSKAYNGSKIINNIISQLPKEVLYEICYDYELMQIFESSHREAYKNISDICMKYS